MIRIPLSAPTFLAALVLALPALPYEATTRVPQDSPFDSGRVEVDGTSYPYRLLSPAKVEEGQRYPLVLFLHGAGERGDDNRAQLRHFPERMATAAYRERLPCFVLAPQCPAGSRWVAGRTQLGTGAPVDTPPAPPMRAAIAALREALTALPVDPDRIYLTGLSMGGEGAWDLASRHSDWFAAAVPICGGGDPGAAERLVGLPLSVWHGAADRVVEPDCSRRMVKAVEAAGGKLRYHELEGVGHNSWVTAYGPDGCLDWLFAQRRDPAARLAFAAERFAAACAPEERVAFLGDSITQAGNNQGGYVDLLRQALAARHAEAAVIPAGISGHKVPDLLRRYEEQVIGAKASLVFVYIGINDVWHSQSGRGTPIDEYEAGLRELLRGLRTSGATVVLATPSVIGERPLGENPLDEMLVDFAAVSRRVAEEEGATLCDLRRAFLDHLSVFNPEGLERGVLTRDGVHLNAAGNAFLATWAARALSEALEGRQR